MTTKQRAASFFTTQGERRFQNLHAAWHTRPAPTEVRTDGDCLAALWAFADRSKDSAVRDIRAFALASIGTYNRLSRWPDESLILALFRNWTEARRVVALIDRKQPDDFLHAVLLALHFSIVHMRPEDSGRLLSSEAVMWAESNPESATRFFAFADSITGEILTAAA